MISNAEEPLLYIDCHQIYFEGTPASGKAYIKILYLKKCLRFQALWVDNIWICGLLTQKGFKVFRGLSPFVKISDFKQ